VVGAGTVAVAAPVDVVVDSAPGASDPDPQAAADRAAASRSVAALVRWLVVVRRIVVLGNVTSARVVVEGGDSAREPMGSSSARFLPAAGVDRGRVDRCVAEVMMR
jgi:hypothetical protein